MADAQTLRELNSFRIPFNDLWKKNDDFIFMKDFCQENNLKMISQNWLHQVFCL